MSQPFKNQFYLRRFSSLVVWYESVTWSHFVKITLHLCFDGHLCTPAGAIPEVIFHPIASNWRGLSVSPSDFPLASSWPLVSSRLTVNNSILNDSKKPLEVSRASAKFDRMLNKLFSKHFATYGVRFIFSIY